MVQAIYACKGHEHPFSKLETYYYCEKSQEMCQILITWMAACCNTYKTLDNIIKFKKPTQSYSFLKFHAV